MWFTFVTARLFISLSFQPRLAATLLRLCSVVNSQFDGWDLHPRPSQLPWRRLCSLLLTLPKVSQAWASPRKPKHPRAFDLARFPDPCDPSNPWSIIRVQLPRKLSQFA